MYRKFSKLVILVYAFLIINTSIPSDAQAYQSCRQVKPRLIPEVVGVDIEERVTILDDVGNCDIDLLMTIHSSPLAEIYRESLNFTNGIPEPEKDIPESVIFEDNLVVDPEINYTANNVTQTPTNISKPFLDGIILEHFYSLGINFTAGDVTRFTAWGDSQNCIVALNATGSFQLVEPGRVIIGPLTVNSSFDRIGFIFNKIGMTQAMLNSFASDQEYVNTWTVHFHGGNGSNLALNGENWYQDFGNGNLLEADIVSIGSIVTLTEVMRITEEPMTAEPEELLEDGILSYKIFDILFTTGLGPIMGNSHLKGAQNVAPRASATWSVNILDETYEWNPISQVTLRIHSVVTLKQYIGWKWKWFKLRWFKAWSKLSATVELDFEVDASYQNEWSKEIFTREKYHVFWVGYVPVEVTFKFTVIGYLEFEASVGTITYHADATGWIKLGVKWKRGDGWSRIRSADLHYTMGSVEITQDIEVTITPKVGFRISALFYHTAGPFIEVKFYAKLTIWPGGDPEWRLRLGFDLNVGIDIGSWIKKALGLREWSWTLYSYAFYECYECSPPRTHDIAVVNINNPSSAYVTEPVDVDATVLNMGQSSESSIDVEFYYKSASSGSWILYDDTTISSLASGAWKTVSFTWATSGLPHTAQWYDLKVEATVSGDEDSSNDYSEGDIKMEIRDIRVSNVEVVNDPPVVFAIQDVEIKVTVVNDGSTTIPQGVIHTYYYRNDIGNQLVGTKYVSNLVPGASRTLTYNWDTWGVELGQYTIKAKAVYLDYETDYDDNHKTDDNVTVVGIPGWYYVDIAITTIGLPVDEVYKGDDISINVDVANQGNSTETFDLTVFAIKSLGNYTIRVQTQVVTLLKSESATVTLEWDTSGKEELGYYQIYAYAWPSQNNTESNLTNNEYYGGWITLSSAPPPPNWRRISGVARTAGSHGCARAIPTRL